MGALQKLMARGGPGGPGMPKSLGGAPPPQMGAPAPGPPMVPPVLRAIVNEVLSCLKHCCLVEILEDQK